MRVYESKVNYFVYSSLSVLGSVAEILYPCLYTVFVHEKRVTCPCSLKKKLLPGVFQPTYGTVAFISNAT